MEAFQAAGNVIQGIGGYEQGKYNKAASDTEALMAERQGAQEEARVREAARAALGQQVAAQGANGMQTGTGSAIDALQESMVNATLDAMNVRRGAALTARAKRAEGAIALAAGKNAMVSGMIGAASAMAPSRVDWAQGSRPSGGGSSGGGGGGTGGGSGASRGYSSARGGFGD